jgi:hypothetical protein
VSNNFLHFFALFFSPGPDTPKSGPNSGIPLDFRTLAANDFTGSRTSRRRRAPARTGIGKYSSCAANAATQTAILKSLRRAQRFETPQAHEAKTPCISARGLKKRGF